MTGKFSYLCIFLIQNQSMISIFAVAFMHSYSTLGSKCHKEVIFWCFVAGNLLILLGCTRVKKKNFKMSFSSLVKLAVMKVKA